MICDTTQATNALAAGVLCLMLLGSSSYAQTVAGATKDSTMTSSKVNYARSMPPMPRASETRAAIRPFQFKASDEELVDLRRRIKATKWPEKETVNDASQGVQLATMQKLAQYWATDYDWRRIEAKLNALPQFITEIDGLDIHFIHVKSK